MQNIEQMINPEDQAMLDALADIPDGAEVVMANAPHIHITDAQRQVAFIDVTPVMMIGITGRDKASKNVDVSHIVAKFAGPDAAMRYILKDNKDAEFAHDCALTCILVYAPTLKTQDLIHGALEFGYEAARLEDVVAGKFPRMSAIITQLTTIKVTVLPFGIKWSEEAARLIGAGHIVQQLQVASRLDARIRADYGLTEDEQADITFQMTGAHVFRRMLDDASHIQGVECLVITFRTTDPPCMANQSLKQLPFACKIAQRIISDDGGKTTKSMGNKVLKATSGDYTFSNRKWCATEDHSVMPPTPHLWSMMFMHMLHIFAATSPPLGGAPSSFPPCFLYPPAPGTCFPPSTAGLPTRHICLHRCCS